MRKKSLTFLKALKVVTIASRSKHLYVYKARFQISYIGQINQCQFQSFISTNKEIFVSNYRDNENTIHNNNNSSKKSEIFHKFELNKLQSPTEIKRPGD